MNLKKIGRETIYMEEHVTVHGLLSWYFVLLNLTVVINTVLYLHIL